MTALIGPHIFAPQGRGLQLYQAGGAFMNGASLHEILQGELEGLHRRFDRIKRVALSLPDSKGAADIRQAVHALVWRAEFIERLLEREVCGRRADDAPPADSDDQPILGNT